MLAAGAWLGGLLALAIVLASDGARAPDELDARNALVHFSGMGYVAVAALVGTGIINSWYLVGSFAGILGTSYGQLLLVKLGVFGCMLALAASNRFRLVPRLQSNIQGDPQGALQQLRRNVIGEQVFGLVVILIVSALGTMEPAVSQLP